MAEEVLYETTVTVADMSFDTTTQIGFYVHGGGAVDPQTWNIDGMDVPFYLILSFDAGGPDDPSFTFGLNPDGFDGSAIDAWWADLVARGAFMRVHTASGPVDLPLKDAVEGGEGWHRHWYNLDTLVWTEDDVGQQRLLQIVVAEPCDASYNCECEDDPGARTLASLRQELMARLGYAAQINNPPPGMTALLNSFLRDAQVQLYHRFTTFKTERFFTWPLIEGVRYYGLGENNDCCEGRSLDPYKITWVGVEDANGVWYPLHHGIPPEFYTMTEQWKGWPARYEIRECIEIFPAPSADMRKLRIKGHFGLRPFSEDEHKTTINPDVLFLWALGTAKSHYGQPDAAVCFQQANDLISRLVAGSHQTARYIPGTRPRRPLTPPRFLPISED